MIEKLEGNLFKNIIPIYIYFKPMLLLQKTPFLRHGHFCFGGSQLIVVDMGINEGIMLNI